MHLLVNGNLLGLNLLFHRGEGETMGFRVVQYMQYGQKLRDIKGCLSRELFIKVPEIIKVVDPLIPDTP